MDYRWVSTAHTRTGWHRICKYILRFVRAHLGARYVWRLLSRGKKSQFRLFLLLSTYLTLSGVPPRKVFRNVSTQSERQQQKHQPNTPVMPTLSDIVSCSYHISHDYPLLHQSYSFSGVMWSRGPGFNSPGECCWKSPWVISLKHAELWSVKHQAHKSFLDEAICAALNVKTAIIMLVWSQRLGGAVRWMSALCTWVHLLTESQ